MRRSCWALCLALTLSACVAPDEGEDALDDQAQALADGTGAIRVVTANVDFGLSAAKVKTDWEAYSPHADVVFLQEARDVRIADVVDTSVWAVRQDPSTESSRGSAVVVRRSISKAGGISGLTLIEGVPASACPGGGIQARNIARVDIQLNSGKLLKVASLHMPPPRCHGPVYDAMANRLVRLINNTPGHLVVGADWNKVVRADPNNLGGRTGLGPRGPEQSIDGFYVRRVTTSPARRLDPTKSDHDPVWLKIELD